MAVCVIRTFSFIVHTINFGVWINFFSFIVGPLESLYIYLWSHLWAHFSVDCLFDFFLHQILLKGASGDELKKVKHVVHYGVFAAYHLALETSFLADEGASLPELPLTSPIKVALPDKPPGIERSISMIAGYSSPSSDKPQAQNQPSSAYESGNDLFLDVRQSSAVVTISEPEPRLSEGPDAPNGESGIRSVDFTGSGTDCSGSQWEQHSSIHCSNEYGGLGLNECCAAKSLGYLDGVEINDNLDPNHFFVSEDTGQCFSFSPGKGNKLPSNLDCSELARVEQQNIGHPEDLGTLKEDFPPSPSDHQSILVSLSTRCVWKGSVCERAHLFRIKYYGNFDKPLGRYLRDHLFDQVSNFLVHMWILMVLV